MNIRLKLATVIIPLGVLVAAIPDSKVAITRQDSQQILAEMKDGSHLVSTDAVADMLVQKDQSLQLIDVRSQSDFEQYHLPGAVNIPLDNILADENSSWFGVDGKMVVLYANGTTNASQAWMLLRQNGYKNLFLMQGGMNYWAETIMNPSRPAATAADDELARYDFRKAAGAVLGGGTLAPSATAPTASAAPAPKPAGGAPKKKRASGGC